MEQGFGKCFEKIALRVGTIIEVDDFSEARKPTNWLKIGLGDAIERSSATIKDPESQDCRPGKPFLGVPNFPPKQAANFFSEVLTTGFCLPPGEVATAHPERKVPNGAKLG